MMRSHRIYRGFTLVELLVVVALIAMIGSVGSGMYANAYKKLLVQRTAKQFLLMARYGRILAVEQGRMCELIMNTGPNGKFFLMSTVIDAETGQSQPIPVKDYYTKPVEMEGEVKFENVDVTTFIMSPNSDDQSDDLKERKITFLPNGSTESAVVQIGDGTWHYTVALLAATGQVTLYEGPAEQLKTTVIDLDEQPR